MKQSRLVTISVLASMPLVLVFVLLFFVVQVATDLEASACLGDVDQAAATVDLDSIPVGPIAGFGKDQLVNAAHVMLAARERDLSGRDQRIGVMTAIGESGLRVLTHGDAAGPDSLGLFQQRDNGAWGTTADRLDPRVSSMNFFKALEKIVDRDLLAPTIAAHRVQRNADPYHYERSWEPAGAVVRALAGVTGAQPVAQTGTSYDLGPVTPQLRALANTLGPKFGITSVGGYRESATDMGGHPAGLAADFMVPLTEKGAAQGNKLAAYAVQNAAELQIDYVIWRQQIWSRSRSLEGWRPMSDRGSPTANHFDHVHINVVPGNDSGTVVAAAACASTAAAGGGTWITPVEGAVTSAYGPRTHPVTGASSFHDGVDYGAACGAPIKAASSGIVVAAGTSTVYGHQIVIDHGRGILTKYGHMYASGLLARPGDQVTTGDVIATVGSDGWSTGCHLHFTVEVDGRHTDPVAFLANPPEPVGIGAGLTVAHANIKFDQSPEAFRADLAITTAGHPDFISLNEVGYRRDSALSTPGYAAFRAAGGSPQARSTAVAWRTQRWNFVTGGRLLLVDDGPQNGDADRSATWATLQSVDGGRASIVSVHHMINPAKIGPNRPRRQRLYAEGMRRLQGLVTTLSQAGPVFVAGDFNSQFAANDPWGPRAMLGVVGMRSTFDARGPVPTHDGGGTIDFIFYRPEAASVTRQATRELRSDHKALIAAFSGGKTS